MAHDQSSRDREVNRYVSQRVRELRMARGLNQSQAAALLARFSDAAWSGKVLSRAELCEGVFIKRWNVDDLYALSAAFEVPVSYFLPTPNVLLGAGRTVRAGSRRR
jgi:transcriptional regulator with XRE-family HTH domain